MNPSEKAPQPMEVGEPQPGPSAGQGSQPLPKAGKYKIKDGAVMQIHLGDSHLREGNKVPELYSSRRAEGLTDPRFGRVLRQTDWETKSNWKEGYRLCGEYLAQLKDLLGQRRGKATALVLSIGTNDLRDSPTRDNLGVLLRNFQDLLDALQTTEGVVLYIIAPIPCANEKVRPLRDELQSELWKLIQRSFRLTGGRVMFVNLTRDINPLIPKGPKGYHSNQYWRDDKHLNRDGALLLVDELIRQQKATADKHFLVDREAWEPISAQQQQQPPQPTPPAAKGGPSIKDRLGPMPKRRTQSGDLPRGSKPGGKAPAPRPEVGGQKRKVTGKAQKRKGQGPGWRPRGPTDEHGGKRQYMPPQGQGAYPFPWGPAMPWGAGGFPPAFSPFGLPVLPLPGPEAGQWWIPPPAPTCRGFNPGASGPRDDGSGGPGGMGGGPAYPQYPPPIHCHFVACWGGCGQTHTH